MCGIAAVLLTPMERSPAVWQEIRHCFTENLLFNEERGKEAAGVGVIKKDRPAAIYKAPLPASQFVQQAAYKQMLNSLDAQTTLILGHARHPTKGDPQNNHNNHPLQSGVVLGVHNGHIHNDDELFARRHYPRQAEVDSEIIFQLLWRNLPASFSQVPLTAVQTQLQQLKGKFAILASDQRAPESLLVARQGAPLSLHYHPKWEALIFSSRYIFLRKTFGRAVLYETLPDRRLLIYNAYQLQQRDSKPIAFTSLNHTNTIPQKLPAVRVT